MEILLYFCCTIITLVQGMSMADIPSSWNCRRLRKISYLSAREELLACYNFVSWRRPEAVVMRAVCHPAQGYPSLLTGRQVCYLFSRPDYLHEWSVETFWKMKITVKMIMVKTTLLGLLQYVVQSLKHSELQSHPCLHTHNKSSNDIQFALIFNSGTF